MWLANVKIPTIINVRIGSPQVNGFSKIVKGRKNGNSSKTMSNHKVLIYSDIHVRCLFVRLKDKLSGESEVTSYTNPNYNIQILLSTKTKRLQI
jgi:hypothetical protein